MGTQKKYITKVVLKYLRAMGKTIFTVDDIPKQVNRHRAIHCMRMDGVIEHDRYKKVNEVWEWRIKDL